jgi:hypothetical protein
MAISESLIAHHEAAHVVLALGFGGQVEYAALVVTGGAAATYRQSA